MQDPFSSGPFATVLAWLFSGGTLIMGVVGTVRFLIEKKDMARPFKFWLVLCFLLFAPTRYIFFLLVAGLGFPVQSLLALLTAGILSLYVPIVFGVLFLVGLGAPLLVTLLVLGDEEKRDPGRYIGATAVLPIVCLLGNVLFFVALPYAAKTIHWLPAEAVIKATNGPAAIAFDHIAVPVGPIAVPPYFNLTPQDSRALRRCHVAWLYLSPNQQARFLAIAYPEARDPVRGEKLKSPAV